MFVDRHPLQLFLMLLIYVFLGEMGIMLILDNIQDKHEFDWLIAFVDASLLTSLSAPFFWFSFLRPLQRALKLESIKSHKILEMAAEGIVTIDTEGSLLSFNRAAQRIFGYSETEILGKNASMLVPSSHGNQHNEELLRNLQTGQIQKIGNVREVQGIRNDGTIFPMELAVTEIKLGDAHFFTAMIRDISEQKLAIKRIEQLAHYDDLTHLPNRSLFYDRLGQAVTIAKRSQRFIALLFIDLDGFKKVNDKLGHHIGDLLLEQVAERLRLCVRESDTLARLGGDEFTILLNDTSERENVEMVAKKVIHSIAQPFDLQGQIVQIGASVGIARYPDDATTSGTLMIVADKAMYAAKAAGKSTYQFGSPSDVTASYPIQKGN